MYTVSAHAAIAVAMGREAGVGTTCEPPQLPSLPLTALTSVTLQVTSQFFSSPCFLSTFSAGAGSHSPFISPALCGSSQFPEKNRTRDLFSKHLGTASAEATVSVLPLPMELSGLQMYHLSLAFHLF